MDIIRKEITPKMSRIVIHNNTVYLCGQVGNLNSPCIKEQTKTMLEKVDTLLQSAGADKDHILSATIYLKDMKDFDALNGIWNAWLTPGCAPARACVQTAMSDPGYLVEISVTAATAQTTS